MNEEEFVKELSINEPYLDRESLVSMMQERVAQLLTKDPDLLFSFLYRLDVDELKIKNVLASAEDVPRKLAELIVNRQLHRIQTKTEYKSDNKNWDWNLNE